MTDYILAFNRSWFHISKCLNFWLVLSPVCYPFQIISTLNEYIFCHWEWLRNISHLFVLYSTQYSAFSKHQHFTQIESCVLANCPQQLALIPWSCVFIEASYYKLDYIFLLLLICPYRLVDHKDESNNGFSLRWIFASISSVSMF